MLVCLYLNNSIYEKKIFRGVLVVYNLHGITIQLTLKQLTLTLNSQSAVKLLSKVSVIS